MKKIVAVAPATSALSMEVVVRVDDGREIILRDGGMQRFVAGDRVRLRSSSHGLRVERRSSIAAVTALRFHEIVRKYGVAKMHNVVINDSSTALNLKGS